MEVEAVDEGTLGQILIAEGTEGVAVNTPIALLAADGESVADAAESRPPAAHQPPSEAEGRVRPKPSPRRTAAAARRPAASPAPPPSRNGPARRRQA